MMQWVALWRHHNAVFGASPASIDQHEFQRAYDDHVALITAIWPHAA
jgi:hypothetical protein